MVEQRNSLPHAVPSSICIMVSMCTLQSHSDFFAGQWQWQACASDKGDVFVLTLLPAKWWTLVLESME